MAKQLRRLSADLFLLTKDGSLICMLYKAMRLVNMENECMELLRRQLWIIRKIAFTSKDILEDLSKESAPMETQTNSPSEDFGSISLDAQASVLVINEFLAQIGRDSSSGYSIACAV